MRRRRLFHRLLAAFAAALCAVCGARAGDAERIETFAREGVTLTLRAKPAVVSLDRDVEVTLELTHPDTLEVALPERFDDRFEGFRFEGSYEGETLVAAGTRRRTLHLRARPLPAAERYRIAPFAVRAGDSWFPTKPVLFEAAGLLPDGEEAPDRVSVALEPVWVHPSARAVLRWVGVATGVAACIALLVWLARKLRRRVVLARMAPRERALLELRELLERDLPAKGRAKEFYVALTFVVRRYIERRYAVRAPEQTTEEFLQEATRHPAFAAATLERLRGFLAAADLVKYAGVAATPATIAASVAGARAYLEGEPVEDRPGRKGRAPC